MRGGCAWLLKKAVCSYKYLQRAMLAAAEALQSSSGGHGCRRSISFIFRGPMAAGSAQKPWRWCSVLKLNRAAQEKRQNTRVFLYTGCAWPGELRAGFACPGRDRGFPESMETGPLPHPIVPTCHTGNDEFTEAAPGPLAAGFAKAVDQHLHLFWCRWGM